MKLVIVDESADTCEMLTFILKGLGHAVWSVDNFSDGVPLVHEHSPDMVMIDLNTKGLPVDQFIKAVQTHCPSVEFVAMSGARTVMVRGHALHLRRYLQKPFEPGDVQKAIGPKPPKVAQK